MENLIKDVEYFIQKDNLKKKCRKRKYIHKRIYLFYTLRRAGCTYQRIADMFDLNHATVIHGIKTYKNLKRTKDELLHLDVAEYGVKIKNKPKKYNLKQDIFKATTLRDLEKIKLRAEKNVYEELI